jgi:hypothetical protein
VLYPGSKYGSGVFDWWYASEKTPCKVEL